jgi:lysozyme family protein
MNFDQAFDVLMGHEGDFSDHEDDPGGRTRFGVTEAVARKVGYRGDMRELPIELAKRIYLEDYWNAVSADKLPMAVRYAVFDGAVNSSPVQSVKWLQRALGVKDDGIVGPVTIGAAYTVDAYRLRSRILSQRLRFMAKLKNWPSFSGGWANRIADLMEMP